MTVQGRVADFVGVALWDHAFDPTHPTSTRLRNGVADADHFIGSDARRFRIRVRDAAAAGPRVEVQWKTVFDAGGDDPEDLHGER